MEEKIREILLETMENLSKDNKAGYLEPEQVVQNTLAMVQIAKLFNLYPQDQFPEI